MARNKKKSRRPKRRVTGASPGRASPAAPASPAPLAGTVTMETAFGKVVVPAEQAGLEPGLRETAEEDFTLLDLADCEAELAFASPGLARRALVQAEGLDPEIADRLADNFPALVPTLVLRGERGRLLAGAPTLRRVRSVSLYSGDTHAALLGDVWGLPRVVLAEFENGRPAEAAAEDLARKHDAGGGRLLVLLVGSAREAGATALVDDGHLVAAHEILLERPVLWHLGERPSQRSP